MLLPENFEVGTYVHFVSATDEQVNWGGNDDPRGVLDPFKTYQVAGIDTRSSHTKLSIYGFPNLKFNSVHFELA